MIFFLGESDVMDFVEIRFDGEIPVDRDDVEDAVNEALSGVGEVTGAGVGQYGSHLDVEVDESAPREQVLAGVMSALVDLGLRDLSRVRPGDGDEWIRPGEWQRETE